VTAPLYNFRLGPEAVWLIVNTVIGAVLTTLMTTDFTSITDYKAWLIGLAIAAGRTLIGAILAAATGGGFQKPGEPGPLTTNVPPQG
jgi:hypothetical protein